MVQDTSPSTEMYLSRSKNGECGGWGIEFIEEDDERVEFADLRECSVLWAVSVPSQSMWSARELDGPVERTLLLSIAICALKYLHYRPRTRHSFRIAHTLQATALSQISTPFHLAPGNTGQSMQLF